MPIVDLAQPDLTTPVSIPKGFAVTPGAVDVDQGSDATVERPAWSSTMSAAFRQDNTVGSYFAASERDAPTYAEPGFNPWDVIKSTKYEPFWESFVDVRNPRAAEAKKRQIDQELEDRKTLQAAPWWQSLPSQMVAGTLDWTTLLPGGAFVRGVSGGVSVARSMASVGLAAGVSTLAQETALQAMQETRPLSESAVNVGASVLLGGLLGAGGARLLSKAEWSAAVKSLDAELVRTPVPGTAPAAAGAAAVEPADLAGNTIAGTAAGAVAAATARLNPALRILQSPSAATREIGTKLFENSIYLKKNFDGVASEPAVETLMKEWNAGLAAALRAIGDTYPEYRKAGGQLSREEFRNAVGRAMRRGDVDTAGDPHVMKVAQAWRSQVFDPPKEAAIDAKLLPPDVSVETAASYFSRMWNRNKLIAQEGRFKAIVTDYYAGAIGKEYEKSAQAFARRTARLDQEIDDLNLPADVRVTKFNELEAAIREHEAQWPTLSEAADRLSDIRSEMRTARSNSDENAVTRLKTEVKTIHGTFPEEALKSFIETRSNLRSRARNVDLGVTGLTERSDRVLGQLADLEEANHRAMERLVKKGQKLERDLDRLDADALEERVSSLADTYTGLARKSEAAAERARKAIESIRINAERGAERNRLAAERAATEAIVGPPEEAAAKRAAAKEAAEKTAQKRAAADAAIQRRLEKEAAQQTARAARMDEVAQRLKASVDFDHDGLMAELRAATDKATREISAQSMARGERAVRLAERIASLDPKRVEARVKVIQEMKRDTERSFFDRWEIRNLGKGVSGPARPDFTDAARAIADTAHATLTGRVESGTRPEFMKITIRGPMKDRTLNIPDKLIEDFLESDVDLVGRRYTRVMGADVELARKFGSPDMAEQIQKVRDDYQQMRRGLTDEKQLMRLGKQEEADVRDLEALRDLLRGTRNENPIERNFGRVVRSFNHLNYLRSMGEVVLASLTDAVRPAMVHGLGTYMGGLAQLATNMKAIKLSVNEAQLAGNVAERVLGHRLVTMAEITDPYASRGPVEALLESMTNVASKWNGIRFWTDGMKSVASVMTQNRILKGVERFGTIKDREKAYLAYLGIDQSMAERIAKQFADHGETMDGVRVANTEQWTDRVVVRAYRAAMNKDVDSIIVQKSVADVPLFASTATGKAMLQFKTFALASHQKILLRGLQEDRARFVGGLVAMTMMGMFITYMKALSGNRPEVQEKAINNPGWWIGEGLDRSGVLSVPMELANIFEKAAGVNPLKSPLKAFDTGAGISQKLQNRNLTGSIAGPSAGLLEDAATTLGIPNRALSGEEITKGQWNAFERVLPFNSYLGIRQMLRYVVNPQD